MAHISHRLGHFTGHIGPVRFTNGEAQTDDPDMLAYFAEDPDTYDVREADNQPPVLHPDPDDLEDHPDIDQE